MASGTANTSSGDQLDLLTLKGGETSRAAIRGAGQEGWEIVAVTSHGNEDWVYLRRALKVGAAR